MKVSHKPEPGIPDRPPDPSSPNYERPALPPPTFSVKSLLLVMFVFSVLFAVYTGFGLNAAIVVSFFMLTVLAHVAGNSIGTRLRDIGDLPQPHDTPNGRPVAARPKRLAATDFAPSTRLRDRYPLGIPIIISTTIGAILGGAVGGAALALVNRENGTVFSIVVGALAFTILGGIWTFIACGFLQVAGGAFVQAIKGRRS